MQPRRDLNELRDATSMRMRCRCDDEAVTHTPTMTPPPSPSPPIHLQRADTDGRRWRRHHQMMMRVWGDSHDKDETTRTMPPSSPSSHSPTTHGRGWTMRVCGDGTTTQQCPLPLPPLPFAYNAQTRTDGDSDTPTRRG